MATAKLFRVTLQVSDLNQASEFYSKLLDDKGVRIPRGARHYYDCGPVILAQVYQRARELGCLSKEDVHDQKAGEIVTRPWGERSFYIDDPWGNGLCFVDEKTLFTGR